MATITAVRSGNWSDTSHVTGPWPGASTPTTKPAAGDTAEAASYTITIDESVTVTAMQASTSGHFEIAAAQTITVTTLGSSGSYAGGLIRCLHTTGIVNIVVTTFSQNRVGIYNVDVGAVNITGTPTGGPSNTDSQGVYNAVGGAVAITGNVTGGGNDRNYGAYNVGVGTITVSGTATGGSKATAHGLYNASTGSVSCNAAAGGSVVNSFGLWGNNSGGVTTYKIISSQANGNSAVGGFCKMLIDATVNSITVKRSDTGADYTLSNDYPAITDVKTGTVYKLGTLTGTLAAGSGGGVVIGSNIVRGVTT